MGRRIRWAALAAALSCSAGVARAHAPLPRGLAVATDGGVAVRMPGFGWLLRPPGDDAAFGYACDALWGVSPLEERTPMAYRSDGSLLVGSASGVRIIEPSGCPVSARSLEGQAVVALAIHPHSALRAYAIVEQPDQPPAVQRSDDGGETWQLAGSLELQPVSALVLDPRDPDTLYVSQKTGSAASQVVVSSNAGASFETFAQQRDLTLLHAQASPRRFWAMARIAGQGVGVVILRASEPAGPWDEVLALNFFGGLAVDPNDPDVIWIGDEARGVFRSSDGGDSFEETQPDIASACLAYGAGALWSCTPGLPEQSALRRSPDALEAFEPIMAFRDVTRLVDCAPDIEVAEVCAAAWVEWQRDVLGVTPALPDAGVVDPPDAAVDAGVIEDADDSGCSAVAARPGSTALPAWLALACAIALRALRRRPRGCGPRACLRTGADPRARPAPPTS